MSVITINPRARRPGPYPPGRRCAEPGCITVLHTRHEGERCYLHPEPNGNGQPHRADTADLLAELMAA